MLNKKLFSIFSVSMLLGLGCLVSCGGGDDPTSNKTDNPTTGPSATTYTVDYYVDGNQYGETLTVEEGSKLTKPTDPTRAEDDEYTYTFNGWYEYGSETAWNFDTDTVNKNLELYAEFEETAKVYDLTIWVYGGSSTAYITEEEASRVKTEVEAALPGKKVLLKYNYGMKNGAFNALVQNSDKKPDLVISGSKINSTSDGENGLTLNETYDKAKAGIGWFSSTTRFVGVLASCEEHLTDAATAYGLLTANGPDYIVFDTESLTLRVGQSYTLTPTLAEGETRTVTYAVADDSIATIDTTGVITPLVEGETEITATLGLVTVTLPLKVVSANYDLVVYVYGVNGASEPTTYITEKESDYMRDHIVADTNFADKSIYWEYVAGLTNKEFNTLVNDTIASGFVIDVVVSGGNLDKKDDNGVALHATYGKVRVGEGWFENTGRRVAVTEACVNHLDLAAKAYGIISATGPKYEGIAISAETAEVEIGKTVTLTATTYGEVTWTSADDTKATVENGVVTGVAVGNVTITATNSKGETATCEVTVKEVPASEDPIVAPKLVAYIYGSASKTTYITEEESNIMKEAVMAAANLTEAEISWNYITKVNAAGFGTEVNNAINGGTVVDLVIGGNNIDSASGCNISLTDNADLAKAKVDASWWPTYKAADGTNRYIGITSGCAANLATATIAYNLFKAAKAA